MKILVIVSACNEAASLEFFLPRLLTTAAALSASADIIVIDDGSTDATAKVVEAKGCRVISNEENLGIGTSLRKGYLMAKEGGYDATVSMDADGQHDERLLPKIIDLLDEGTDIVVASRYHKDSERMGVPIDRDLLNIAVTAQIRIVTGWDVSDPLCGFWAMRRPCFNFALEHGRQQRYGVHLEHLVKFWHLCEPRPTLVEMAHPAIYQNHGTRYLLTRQYSPANKEVRMERFGTHALHILEALEDVQRIKGHAAVDLEIAQRRTFGISPVRR